MPLGTLDRNPPPFFKQGPSALSKLIFFSVLAVFLMVADVRLHIVQPLRAGIGAVLYPLQTIVRAPLVWASRGSDYFASLEKAQQDLVVARKKQAEQAERAMQVELFKYENERLRALLALREDPKTQGLAAEVVYDAPDPFTRKVIIDKGAAQGVQQGSPVLDELGVLGQVTRVHAGVSEISLLTDRDQAIPVLNARTGNRSVAFGDPVTQGGVMELRFTAANSDIQEQDLLLTSGIDGVYPAGLPVAKVSQIDRRAESAFARIYCTPVARVAAAKYVTVLTPVGAQLPARPEEAASAVTGRRGRAAR